MVLSAVASCQAGLESWAPPFPSAKQQLIKNDHEVSTALVAQTTVPKVVSTKPSQSLASWFVDVAVEEQREDGLPLYSKVDLLNKLQVILGDLPRTSYASIGDHCMHTQCKYHNSHGNTNKKQAAVPSIDVRRLPLTSDGGGGGEGGVAAGTLHYWGKVVDETFAKNCKRDFLLPLVPEGDEPPLYIYGEGYTNHRKTNCCAAWFIPLTTAAKKQQKALFAKKDSDDEGEEEGEEAVDLAIVAGDFVFCNRWSVVAQSGQRQAWRNSAPMEHVIHIDKAHWIKIY